MLDNSELLKADGFDDAMIGIGVRFNDRFIVYDYDKVIEILIMENMTHEEAIEHFDYNIAGAFVGESTPAFVTKAEMKDIE